MLVRTSRLLTLLIIWSLGSTAIASTPKLMNYQGRLTSATGTALVGTYSVRFTIYDASVGGTSKWFETQNVTSDANGLFAILLGSVTPIRDTVLNDTVRYLGIQVGADPELTPRTRLVTVPYAQRVSSIDGSAGGWVGGKLAVGPSADNPGTLSFAFGAYQSVTGQFSAVSGGEWDTVSGDWSGVAGGQHNAVTSDNSAIGGGYGNRVAAAYGVVAGGNANYSSGLYGAVGGGNADSATGWYSCVPGGSGNKASGSYSLAAGRRAKADWDGSFVWGDATNADISAGAPNRFLVRATNGAFFTAGKVNVGDPAGNATVISKGDYRQDNSIIAWGKVTGSTGFVSTNEYGVSNVVRNSTGNYTITLDVSADASANLIPIAVAEIDVAPNSAATARVVSINQVTANSFDVYILNGNWVATDNDFTFMVTAR